MRAFTWPGVPTGARTYTPVKGLKPELIPMFEIVLFTSQRSRVARSLVLKFKPVRGSAVAVADVVDDVVRDHRGHVVDHRGEEEPGLAVAGPGRGERVARNRDG